MDTVNIVLDAITTVGFPIVCCVALMLYVKYMRDSDAEERQKMNEQHAAESKAMADALNSNTVVLQKLCDKLDAEGVTKVD